jgi:hypothetical protein
METAVPEAEVDRGLEEEIEDIVVGNSRVTKLFLRAVKFIRHNNSAFAKILVTLLFYGGGVLYYSNKEGWSIVDCIYFITVTSKLFNVLFNYLYLL